MEKCGQLAIKACITGGATVQFWSRSMETVKVGLACYYFMMWCRNRCQGNDGPTTRGDNGLGSTVIPIVIPTQIIGSVGNFQTQFLFLWYYWHSWDLLVIERIPPTFSTRSSEGDALERAGPTWWVTRTQKKGNTTIIIPIILRARRRIIPIIWKQG